MPTCTGEARQPRFSRALCVVPQPKIKLEAAGPQVVRASARRP
jgi:hypothetical protein